MKEQTRKEMQQKLADYRQPAPDISWAELEKALPAPSKQNATAIWGRRIAAAAAILLIAGMGWLFTRTDKETDTPQVAETITQKKTAKPLPESDQQERQQTSVPEQNSPATPFVTPFASQTVVAINDVSAKHKKESDNSAHSSSETASSEKIETNQGDSNTAAEHNLSKSHTEQQAAPPGNHQQVMPETNKPTPAPNQEKSISRTDVPTLPQNQYGYGVHDWGNRLTAQVYLSNAMTNSSSVNSIFPQMAPAYTYDMNSNSNSLYDFLNGDKAVFLYPKIPEIEEHVNHRQPVRFGLSLRYQLDKQWGIETGMTYTHSTSDITRISNSGTYEMEQRLTYIGVPVSASYRIWSDRHFNVYASAGGIMEKMVKGSRETDGFKEKVHIRPLQFSLTGAAGAEYKIDQTFSIYAEPGVAYHIDNHSNIPTYYQDKPFGFNLNIGLRLHFDKEP